MSPPLRRRVAKLEIGVAEFSMRIERVGNREIVIEFVAPAPHRHLIACMATLRLKRSLSGMSDSKLVFSLETL